MQSFVRKNPFLAAPVSTQHFQTSLALPRVPQLKATMDALAASVPIGLSAEDHARVSELARGIAADTDLCKTFAKLTSAQYVQHIAEDWDNSNLAMEDTVPHDSCGLLCLPDTEVPPSVPAGAAGLVRAANLVLAVVHFRNALEKGTLFPPIESVDIAAEALERKVRFCRPKFVSAGLLSLLSGKRAAALDTGSLYRLFNTFRAPSSSNSGSDDLRTESGHDHIVVLFRDAVFKVNVCERDGTPVSAPQLLARLRAITAEPHRPADFPVAALTGARRKAWGSLRRKLTASVVNADTLAQIDTALFVLCLDSRAPADDEGLIRQLVPGLGTNRWWGKSLQLVVCPNGRAGVVFDNLAAGDGGYAVTRLCDDAAAFEATLEPVPPNESAAEPVEQLRWEVDDETKRAVRDAQTHFRSQSQKQDTSTVVTDWQPVLKHPVALQVFAACSRASRDIAGPHLPSCMHVPMSHFRNGRPEAVFSTPELHNAITNGTFSNAEREATLSSLQREVLKAKLGQGCLPPVAVSERLQGSASDTVRQLRSALQPLSRGLSLSAFTTGIGCAAPMRAALAVTCSIPRPGSLALTCISRVPGVSARDFLQKATQSLRHLG
eukprot:TRINITY_DN43305_c0_g1_i1.p1 TRINITY_DN43305_c0_g1~~TRINITY_DN43305_c0_g1_i1.p1  ORF type:complete len:616 (+),score=87.04 TRINITY_DN43305_c0_g1_i1:29-1849(+)